MKGLMEKLVNRSSSQTSEQLIDMANYFQGAAQGEKSSEQLPAYDDEVLSAICESFRTVLARNERLKAERSTHIAKLSETIGTVKSNSEMGFYVSDMIKEATLGVSRDAVEQTEMVRTSSSTVADIVEAIRYIAGNADEASIAANETALSTANGQEAIVVAIDQIGTANSTVGHLLGIMKKLDESSQKIGSFTTIITEIAEQTHLLALNAAIEAARFGDEGRGFSVIASEVRKLAEQSAQSAKKVTAAVAMIREETGQAVTSTEEVVEQVNTGLVSLSDAGSSFSLIKQSISEVAGQIQEVSSAVEEIATSTEQLFETMKSTEKIAAKTSAEMNNVTQAIEEHHSLMEGIAQATDSLSSLSQALAAEAKQ